MRLITKYPVVQNGKSLTPNLYYDTGNGEDFYDADGDYSEARGKKRKGVKSRKPKNKRAVPKRKGVKSRKPKNKRAVPNKNSQANFTKKVMNALGDDKFFNADGMSSVEFGI